MPSNSTIHRVALITGASRGLGAVIARLLAGQGVDLVVTARGREALEESVNALRPYNARVVAIAGDVADADHRRKLVQAAAELGGLNILVNNASDLGPLPMHRLADLPTDALVNVFSINVVAPLGLVQEALPLLKASHGLVVNLTSDAAQGGYETWGGYGSSKAALDLISKTLASELRGDGVGVVSVDPGEMQTEMLRQGYGEDVSDRPLPEVTLPFWSWLFNRAPLEVSGERFQAQSDVWEVRGEA